MTQHRLLYPAVLVASGAGWGVTVSLGKIAVSTGYGPLGLIFWQFVVAALTLGLIQILRRRPIRPTLSRLRFAALIAVVGTLAPNSVFYIAVGQLRAGIVAIVTSMIPLFSYILAIAIGADRPERGRIMGLVLGLCGVMLIAIPDGSLAEGVAVGWVLFALMAPVFYAVEANIVDRFGTAGMGPIEAMFLISVTGAVMTFPLAIGTGQWINPMNGIGEPELALILSSVLHALAYSAYVWLAANAGAVFAAQSSYIVTASGVFWAMALLGERFSGWVWVSLLLIFVGLAFVQPRRAGVAGEGLAG